MKGTSSESIKVAMALEPGDHNASAPTGDEIDTNGFEEGLLIVHVATLAGTDPTLTVKLQEATASGGSFADVTGATTVGIAATADETIYTIGVDLKARKRFLKAVATHGGTPTEASYGATFALSEPTLGPVSQLQTAVRV